MSRFDVGDKVKIVRTNLDSQREYIGRVREVVNTDIGGAYLDNMPDDDDYYLDSELALIEPNADSWDDIVVNTIDKKVREATDETKNWFKGKPVVSMDDDSIDAIRYCIEDWIVTKDYCEKIKEEKDMNKVLNLWYERKKNKIDERYKLMEVQFYNDKYSVVGSFNELIEKFNNDLDDLYKLDKATEQFVLKENTPNNVIKYCLDLDSLKERFNVEYLIEKNKEIEELGKIKEEVEAQLSLSDDLEYQQEVLKRYGIIDKKTKKISE